MNDVLEYTLDQPVQVLSTPDDEQTYLSTVTVNGEVKVYLNQDNELWRAPGLTDKNWQHICFGLMIALVERDVSTLSIIGYKHKK